MVFAIYGDSFLFVFATAILQFGFGVDHSMDACASAILLCLVCYVTTKVRCPRGKEAAFRMLANLGYRLYGVFPATVWRFGPLTAGVVADISVLG